MLLAFLRAVVRRFTSDEEIELIERIAQKDTEALQALYDLYAKLVYSLVYRILGSQEDAEDLVQEVFMLVWEKASVFDRKKGNVYGWLVTLSRNRAIDRTRSEKSKRNKKQKFREENKAVDFAMTMASDTPFDLAMMSQRAELLQEAMQKIPDEQREVIMMAYFGGLSQSEIAEHADLPLGTVKTRMRQGMRKLQGHLAGQLG